MPMNLLNWIHIKYFDRRSYLILQYCIRSPDDLKCRLNNLNSPANGFDIKWAFQMSNIDVRFGEAMIRNKIRKIILLDIKSSRYERSAGRYIAYTLTEVGNELYRVNYTEHGSHRLPSRWKECFESTRYNLI